MWPGFIGIGCVVVRDEFQCMPKFVGDQPGRFFVSAFVASPAY